MFSSIAHLLFRRGTRQGYGSRCSCPLHGNSSRSHFLSFLQNFQPDFRYLLAAIIWSIWKHCNFEALAEWTWSMSPGCGPCSAHHGRMGLRQQQEIGHAAAVTHPLAAVQEKMLVPDPIELIRWQIPLPGRVKCNIDASFSPHFRLCRTVPVSEFAYVIRKAPIC